MLTIGIDIGMHGALAVVGRDAAVSVADLPVRVTEKDKRLDGGALHGLMQQAMASHGLCRVVAENVSPRLFGNDKQQRNTMHSQGSLMISRGIIQGVCDVLALEVRWVEPQSWKRHYGLLGKDKEASRQMAIALMPEMAASLAQKKDEGRSEALLIARYGLQKF